ncbi:MAG: cation:proton antiporter [Synechococcaceae cyanobacterium SM2_3_2]|nr:cation:proton antiporter [Synechococcaceae cyanobacterium SM2_3_2]
MNAISINSNEAITILWLALPLVIGFICYLWPRFDRVLALGVALASFLFGLPKLWMSVPQTIHLIDQVGVTLSLDSLSGFFVVTNALVTLSVILYYWQSKKSAFFYTQVVILHSCVNAVFVCSDFMSLYVALEVISITTFLLIAYPRTHRSIWVGLRYLFVSNTAMLFYLIGAVLVYQTNQSFAFSGLAQASTEAVVLILVGLLTKGGIFLSGLWLPLTHAESETGVSALLSGSVINAGVFPLIRCALAMPDLGQVLGILATGSALLGVAYAITETDIKRLLAFSTVSQMGFVLMAPPAAGFYALTHGLAKAALFLLSGSLPSRDRYTLQQTSISLSLWIALVMASLSMSGFPLLAGFGSKILVLKDLAPWQSIAMNTAALGTTIAMTTFLLIPLKRNQKQDLEQELTQPKKTGLGLAITLLLSGLIAANFLHLEVYTLASISKAVSLVLAGWLVSILGLRQLRIHLPKMMEQFKHLIGVMSLALTLLFWMVVS